MGIGAVTMCLNLCPMMVGMGKEAQLFVPPQCKNGPCHLLILPGMCIPIVPPVAPDPDDAFARYAITNDIVILQPCQGGSIDRKRFPQNHENLRGMVDVYGQLSANYATQKGDQMEPIGKMMKKLIGI